MKCATQLHKGVSHTCIALAIVALAFTGSAQTQTEQTKPYPLTVCVVSGEKLGAMGDPYVFTHQGRQIKLCCKGCLAQFNKDPNSYIKKIEQAEKANKTDSTSCAGQKSCSGQKCSGQEKSCTAQPNNQQQ